MRNICNVYLKFGCCKWGAECWFVHAGTRASTQDNDSARVHSEEQTRDGHGSRESEESARRKRKLSERIEREEGELQAQMDLVQQLKRQKRFEEHLGGEPCPKKQDDAPPWKKRKQQGRSQEACPQQWDTVPREEEEEEEEREEEEEEEEDAEEDFQGRMRAISKALCSILRHNAVNCGLEIKDDGFCELKEVLKLPTMRALRVSMIDVEQLTLLQKQKNYKRRFEQRVHDGKQTIRALQGHSMPEVVDEALLEELSFTSSSLPVMCFHGTYRKHLKSIQHMGLIPGGQGKWSRSHPRHHIHCTPYDFGEQKKNRAADLKDNICHGVRDKYDAGILINMRKAMRDGIKFFRSGNGAILTRGGRHGVLHPRYFSRVSYNL